jgi:hypothetical protein
MTLRKVTSVLAAAIMLVILVQPVSAQTQTEATFDASTNELNLSISNGAEETYTVHVVATGCVTVGTAGVDSTSFDGPENSGSIAVQCETANSSGNLEIQFCIGVNCFKVINVTMVCREDCSMHSTGQVPALSTWGMLILAIMLIATTIWVMRRKRVRARQGL